MVALIISAFGPAHAALPEGDDLTDQAATFYARLRVGRPRLVDRATVHCLAKGQSFSS